MGKPETLRRFLNITIRTEYDQGENLRLTVIYFGAPGNAVIANVVADVLQEHSEK